MALSSDIRKKRPKVLVAVLQVKKMFFLNYSESNGIRLEFVGISLELIGINWNLTGTGPATSPPSRLRRASRE